MMNLSIESLANWAMALGGLSVSLLTGAFGYTFQQIAKCRRESHDDVETFRHDALKRLDEGRDDRIRLREEVVTYQTSAEVHRTNISTCVARLPTREEVGAGLDKMEKRLMDAINHLRTAH